MAYNPRTINVLDTRPSTGVGVALPFNQPAVFRTVYTTQEQIKYNIINYLLTNPGERIYELEFGAGLRRKLFNQITAEYLEDLNETIKSGIERYFPGVDVKVASIVPYADENIVTITINYTISSTGQDDEITINLENV